VAVRLLMPVPVPGEVWSEQRERGPLGRVRERREQRRTLAAQGRASADHLASRPPADDTRRRTATKKDTTQGDPRPAGRVHETGADADDDQSILNFSVGRCWSWSGSPATVIIVINGKFVGKGEGGGGRELRHPHHRAGRSGSGSSL
jgi:hypothetical protein